MPNSIYILAIETSTKACSVAVSEGEKLIASIEEIGDQYVHSERLTVLIEKVIREAEISMNQLKAIAVSKGPGSFTGLRIGVSAAKGLCYALNIPLISLDSLSILSNDTNVKGDYYVPMIDARRMEVYCCVYNSHGEQVFPVQAKVIEEGAFDECLERGQVVFLGDGADKCSEVITHTNAHFISNAHPLAKNMVKGAFQKFSKGEFEDTAYFEPYYLKEFVAGTPKKQL